MHSSYISSDKSKICSFFTQVSQYLPCNIPCNIPCAFPCAFPCNISCAMSYISTYFNTLIDSYISSLNFSHQLEYYKDKEEMTPLEDIKIINYSNDELTDKDGFEII